MNSHYYEPFLGPKYSYHPQYYAKKINSNIKDNSSVSSDEKIDSNIKNDDKNRSSKFSFLGSNFEIDDILIICIIFFLYSEKIKDNLLFILLFMLLLS